MSESKPTAHQLVEMSLEIALGTRLENSALARLSAAHEAAWERLKRDIDKIIAEGGTPIFPD